MDNKDFPDPFFETHSYGSFKQFGKEYDNDNISEVGFIQQQRSPRQRC